MNYISIWNKDLNQSKINRKNFKEIETDILIIGAGITGLTTAYFLKNTNNKIVIIDKGKISNGITLKTTAKISYIQQDIYRKLTKMHGEHTSKLYYDSQKEAINIITKIIKDNSIDCNLEKVESILLAKEDKNVSKLEEERKILTSYGEKIVDYHDKDIKHAFKTYNNYTFNPIKYINGLKDIIKDKADIYENTLATNIKKDDNKYLVTTNNGTIKTNKIILACHYPFFIIPYFFPIKTYIEREYVCAAKVDKPKKETLINVDKDLYSVRYYQDYLIYGGYDHRLTSQIDYAKNYDIIRKDFLKNFKKNPTYIWMNQDIVSNDEIPIIGKIKNNIYISSAYHAWGMTNSTIGAKLIADLIQNKENKYVSLFNPRRINLPLIINSIIGIFHYLKAYIEGLFHKSNPHYVKINGIFYGIYIDKLGKEHKVKLLCPHMKCSLVFNKKELTWDCPCHGSRFDIDGNIIETPAIKKI